jgi:hypothetical protein
MSGAFDFGGYLRTSSNPFLAVRLAVPTTESWVSELRKHHVPDPEHPEETPPDPTSCYIYAFLNGSGTLTVCTRATMDGRVD